MPSSVYDSPIAWMLLAFIAVALFKFLPHFFWYRAFKGGRVSHSKPLRGGPTLVQWQTESENQTQEEINAERTVAYRMSGGGLMIQCWIGGVLLLAIGLVDIPRLELALGDGALENAGPGIASLIFGFWVWRQIRT